RGPGQNVAAGRSVLEVEVLVGRDQRLTGHARLARGLGEEGVEPGVEREHVLDQRLERASAGQRPLDLRARAEAFEARSGRGERFPRRDEDALPASVEQRDVGETL